MSDFGEIRSLLHGEPGDYAWEVLCDILDAYQGPDPLDEVVLPYCHRQLARWPAGIRRRAPESWVRRAMAGEVEKGLELITHLDLTGYTKFV